MTNEELAKFIEFMRSKYQRRGTRNEHIHSLMVELEKALRERDRESSDHEGTIIHAELWRAQRDAAHALLREINEGLVGWPSLSHLRVRITALLEPSKPPYPQRVD
jgi:hypothetical protein